MEETFRAKLVSILKSWCMGLYQMMACCCCCKLLKVQNFRRVPTCTTSHRASHRGVPAEAVEAVAAAALPAIPTWKPSKLGRKEPNGSCSKYKASEEFLHVQLLRQGVPAETFEAVVTSALPTWKPPNYEKNILIQTTQCTKLQKSSYMYCFSSFSQRSLLPAIPSWIPPYPKEKSQNYSKEPKLFKIYLWYRFCGTWKPEKRKKVDHIILFWL